MVCFSCFFPVVSRIFGSVTKFLLQLLQCHTMGHLFSSPGFVIFFPLYECYDPQGTSVVLTSYHIVFVGFKEQIFIGE
jgi:hypothetical protein